MSKKNPPDINDLLVRIGLVKNNKVLAQVRDYGIQGTHYDLVLSIDPETAAKMVEKKLGVEADYHEEDGSHYWQFTIDDEWEFYFELYNSGSEYMCITDLREPKPEPVIPQIIEISNKYQEFKNNIKKQEAEFAKTFSENFKADMMAILQQVKPIKAVVWTQYSMWRDGMEHEFTVYRPHFLSFVPKELKEYYDDSEDLLTGEDFILSSSDLERSKYLTEAERNTCIQMREIIINNDPLFYSMFGDHKAICLAENGLKIQHYDHLA